MADSSVHTRRVMCPHCRFLFAVSSYESSNESPTGFCAEAQCPSCDYWSLFSIVDAADYKPMLPVLIQNESFSEPSKVCEDLLSPIRQNQSHPAMVHFDRVGNGFFEDDMSQKQWPVPWCVYRFRQGEDAAYVWNVGGEWVLRPWHRMSERSTAPEALMVSSFEAALEWLITGAT